MSLQKKLFQQLNDKSLFEQAQTYSREYLDQVMNRKVFPTEEAIQQLAAFDEPLPEEITSPEAVLDQLNQYGSPNTLPTTGGRYFGFVTGGVVPVGMAAKHLATYWDQASSMYINSPISSKLETVVEGWYKDLFHLPDTAVAGFVSGTSAANLCGLAAARYRLLERQGWEVNEKGLFDAPKIRVVTGKHAHSTVLKAIAVLGLGKQNIEWVAVDEQGRIVPEDLPELDDKTLLVLQAGNVNSGAFDNFAAILPKARAANAWVHIDGAFGLWAQAVEELKHLTQGMEGATSWAVDGHKTLNTPYDSGIILCADAEALSAALNMTGSYIVFSKERDGMRYTPEMSRRSRIIEMWAIMKYLGKKGIDEMVLGMHQRARQFAEEIQKIEGFSVPNEVVFNQVMVQCQDDETTQKVLEAVQQLRTCWVGGATWFGKKVIRVSVCSWATTEEDITASVESFVQALW